MTASPIKLKNGEWGAKVSGTPRVGERITITTSAGKSWSAEVAKVVWSGDGVAIVATRTEPATCCVGGQHYKRESGYCYYPCPVTGLVCSPKNGPCHDCQ